MNRRRVLRVMLLKELWTLSRDRQQLLALGAYLVMMVALGYILETREPTELERNPLLSLYWSPRATVLAGAGCLYFILSFLAVPQALSSFVGDKEERTIELLLAAPMPDSTLYLLKFLGVLLPIVAVQYAFALLAGLYLLIFHTGAVMAKFSAMSLLGSVALTLPLPWLFSALQAGLAAAISVRAETKKGAEQLFGAVLIGFMGLTGLSGTLLWRMAPADLTELGFWWLGQGLALQYLTVAGSLALFTLLLLGFGLWGFQRERLL